MFHDRSQDMNEGSKSSPSWLLPVPVRDSLIERLLGLGTDSVETKDVEKRLRVRTTTGPATVTFYKSGTCTVAGTDVAGRGRLP
jgi:hypothetical protein